MQRAFVLGSGFSVMAGAPLSRSVLSDIFHSDRSGSQILELKSYLDEFLFRGERSWHKNTGLEEVLSRLDLIRHYRPYPHVDYEKVSYYEELLLEEFAKLLSPKHVNCTHPAYSLFGQIIENGDVFISFNYDQVIENLLASAGRTYDYNLLPGPSPATSGLTDLLKLHGSINLYYCPRCSEVYHFPSRATERPAGLRHFIIAPTLFKSYSLPVLRRLWFKALESLTAVREIIFIGYSLPEADILSYQLFDFAARLARQGQKVSLVNGPQLQPERFRQIYGRKLVDTGLYFEQWVNQFTLN